MRLGPLAGLLLLSASALAGCTSCTDFPATAYLAFAYAGSSDELRAELFELGWRVEDRTNSLLFDIEREHEGTTYRAVVEPAGLERAGNVTIFDLKGSLAGEMTDEEARAHLAPVVEPLASRFRAAPEYGRGARHCGTI